MQCAWCGAWARHAWARHASARSLCRTPRAVCRIRACEHSLTFVRCVVLCVPARNGFKCSWATVLVLGEEFIPANAMANMSAWSKMITKMEAAEHDLRNGGNPRGGP